MKNKEETAIFWFRRDLRLDDNTGLNLAIGTGKPVLCLFIFDRLILDKLADKDDARLSFIYEAISRLKAALQKMGSDLVVKHDTPRAAWKEVLAEYAVREVVANEDYEPYARSRDKEIEIQLNEQQITFRLCKDQVIFSPSEILKADGLPYTIFTPYKNRWLAQLSAPEIKADERKLTAGDLFQTAGSEALVLPSLAAMGFIQNKAVFPGISYKAMLEEYARVRDFPGLDGTSRLGIHLRFGTLSIRTLYKDAHEYSAVFLSELVWREFYFQILWHFPQVNGHSFKPAYDRINWINDEADFGRWCRGETGFPMVDAGMRQLNKTGFIHNRLRMVVASFLCKDLLIDWRWGEAYFARKLLDFELSSNNGGWQWAAGTGCDAAPYFRIFNPSEQLKKFDPDLSFTREWVPEFQELSYQPMVDHKFARDRCLKVYKEALGAV